MTGKTSKPWEEEPNYHTEIYRGYDILIRRHSGMGHLCGYVRAPLNSKFYCKDHYSFPVCCLSAHGGITYSGFIKSADCPSELDIDEMGWWIGFDCGHYMDYIPYIQTNYPDAYETCYRDFNYVRKECRDLADQMIYLDSWRYIYPIENPDAITWCKSTLQGKFAYLERINIIAMDDDRDAIQYKLAWFNTPT